MCTVLFYVTLVHVSRKSYITVVALIPYAFLTFLRISPCFLVKYPRCPFVDGSALQLVTWNLPWLFCLCDFHLETYLLVASCLIFSLRKTCSIYGYYYYLWKLFKTKILQGRENTATKEVEGHLLYCELTTVTAGETYNISVSFLTSVWTVVYLRTWFSKHLKENLQMVRFDFSVGVGSSIQAWSLKGHYLLQRKIWCNLHWWAVAVRLLRTKVV